MRDLIIFTTIVTGFAGAPGRRMDSIEHRDVRNEEKSEAARYIATLASELAAIARRNGLHTLGYLLDMAKLEAEQAAGLQSDKAR